MARRFRRRFRRLRRFASRVRTRYVRVRNRRRARRSNRRSSGRRSKKIFGMSYLMFAGILAVLAYLFVTPVKTFVNGLIGKK